MNHYLTVQLNDSPPIGSVDQNGESAQRVFGERWPIVYRLLTLAVEQEMNVNADLVDEFPETAEMTGRAEITSIEYGTDYAGEPTATYLVRCNAKSGGYYMTVEVIFGLRADGESIVIKQTNVSVG